MKVLLLGSAGYIGSLFSKKTKFSIQNVDLCLFKKPIDSDITIENYNNVDISEADVIICLAGHSSVQMCEHSPSRSWTNNVQYFRNLCERLLKHQKLIYASSASVYGKTLSISTEDSDINFNVLNHYDLQKITIDLIANKYIAEGKNIIGLRFGTVNGASPNTRSDLMINSMVKSAIDTGCLNVKNSSIRRAILGINDACRAIELLVEEKVESGQYNLASFNSNVGDIANAVSEITKADVIKHQDDLIAYDFELSTQKFINATGFTFKDNLETLVQGLREYSSVINFDVRDNDRYFEHYMS
jgi:nucleoside-diphosphate-sugar epimerase